MLSDKVFTVCKRGRGEVCVGPGSVLLMEDVLDLKLILSIPLSRPARLWLGLGRDIVIEVNHFFTH